MLHAFYIPTQTPVLTIFNKSGIRLGQHKTPSPQLRRRHPCQELCSPRGNNPAGRGIFPAKLLVCHQRSNVLHAFFIEASCLVAWTMAILLSGWWLGGVHRSLLSSLRRSLFLGLLLLFFGALFGLCLLIPSGISILNLLIITIIVGNAVILVPRLGCTSKSLLYKLHLIHKSLNPLYTRF